jgi:hypothetical protein
MSDDEILGISTNNGAFLPMSQLSVEYLEEWCAAKRKIELGVDEAAVRRGYAELEALFARMKDEFKPPTRNEIIARRTIR